VTRNGNFFNLYNHDFVRIAVGVPPVRVADPAYNSEQTIALIRDASERKAVLALFPELGLSAYSCDDLFQQRALLDACLDAIAAVVEATSKLSIVSVVGAPLQVDNHLYNCAIVIHRGKILGVVPKTNLPNYREFYEPRQFTSADAATRDEIDLAGNRAVPFGNNLIFQHEDQPLLAFHAEICEDLWVLRGAGRRDRAAKSVGVQHHDWQGRLSPLAGREPVRAMPRRVRILGGGRR
jgi:NAD+ synthase (glutamine-hydrolysing)